MMRRVLLSALVLALLLPVLAWGAEAGLVGYWCLDSAGPQITDLSGQGHNATLTGGQVMTEGARRFVRMDGTARLEVPSAPELCPRPGFSVETRVRLSDLKDGRLLAFKDNEFLLRLDWPVESSRFSFFLHDNGGWEPRANGPTPLPNTWYHLAAVWDGSLVTLWVNGLPYTVRRAGLGLAPTNNPLIFGGTTGFGKGIIGDMEYVKVYRRALSTTEVIKAAYGADGAPASPLTTTARFDFTQGPGGFLSGEDGKAPDTGPGGLTFTAASTTSSLRHDHLQVDIRKRDYLVLRMAANQGNTATLVFVTTKGAGRVPFPIQADGALHTYILEPWQYAGWDGELMLVDLLPSNIAGATVRIPYLRFTEEPEGEGEIALRWLTTETTLPRAGRSEKVSLRLINTGGPARNVQVTLQPPKGIELLSKPTQALAKLDYQQEQDLTWVVRAKSAVSGKFAVTASGPNTNQARLQSDIAFLAGLNLPKAAYVPAPKRVDTGRYRLWTHYCPLWKHGTHTGWKAIEPYPNRKPVLGWFNEGTPEVADWHIKYMLEHGISGIMYCWYRAVNHGPVQQNLGHAIHDGLLKSKYLSQIEFGIMWENGCGAGTESADDLLTNVFPFWLDNYFTNPSYLKIDGKPVLYVWVPRNVTRDLGSSEKVKETFDVMRAKCRERGLKGLYIVGCMGGVDKEGLARMKAEGWDATSAYGNGFRPTADAKVVGDMTLCDAAGFAPEQEEIWKGKEAIGALPDITSAMMGWDSRPWQSSKFAWVDNTAEKFRDLCLRAKRMMDARPGNGPDANTLIFCCWNEFGEGHYIEPTRGYGFSYLDVIRDVFSTAPKQHTDLAPEDVGLGPYDSWYREARAAALRPQPSLTAWSGQDLATWNSFMGVDERTLKDGVLRLHCATTDPALSSPTLKLRASHFTKLVVDMRVSKSDGAQLFWMTASQPGANEGNSVHTTTVADGQFHPVVFDLGQHEGWGGCVTGLRLDPTSVGDSVVEIKGIRFE